MHIHRCDHCGEVTGAEPDGLLLIAVRQDVLSGEVNDDAPEPPFLGVTTKRKRRPKEERFELCGECAMAMLITFKRLRADIQRGRKGATA